MKQSVWRQTPTPVKWLFVNSFLMNMGFYALIPYLTLHLTGSFGWTLALTGLLLGIRQFSQQGFAFIGGMMADKFGYKGTLLLGCVVRGSGFMMFAFCTETWQFFVAAILSGLGGSLFEPALSACYAILTPESIRKQVFTLRNVLSNIGVVGSQLIAVILATINFYWLSVFSGLLYFGCAFMVLFSLPALRAGNMDGGWTDGLKYIMKDRRFIRFTLLLIGFFYINMQIFFAVPQFVEDQTGSKTAVGIVLATISASVILFQMKVVHWLRHYEQQFTLIGIGTVLMSLGLFLLPFSPSLWMMMVDAFIFALGTMLSIPYMMDLVPRFSPKEHIGAYYGFYGYSLAIGGSIGTYLGGWIYDAGKWLGMPWLPWTLCLLIGLLVGWNLSQMEETRRQTSTRHLM